MLLFLFLSLHISDLSLPSPDYQQAQFRQYQRLTKALKPDVESYERSVTKWGDDFTANSLSYAEHGKVSKEGVDRMVEDLKSQ